VFPFRSANASLGLHVLRLGTSAQEHVISRLHKCGCALAPRDQKLEVRKRFFIFFYILYLCIWMIMLYGKVCHMYALLKISAHYHLSQKILHLCVIYILFVCLVLLTHKFRWIWFTLTCKRAKASLRPVAAWDMKQSGDVRDDCKNILRLCVLLKST